MIDHTKFIVSFIAATFMAASLAGSYVQNVQNAFAQVSIPTPSPTNNTTMTNQTEATNQTEGVEAAGSATQKQTAAARANLTTSDFGPIMNSLITARQEILNNNSASAYGAINAAGSQLFQLTQIVAGDNESLAKQLTNQLSPLLNATDNSRDALRDNNNVQALRELNSADVRLLRIMQQLPTEQIDNEDGAVEGEG